MTAKTPKTQKSCAASTSIRDLLEGAETPSQQLARLVTQSSGAASTVKRYTETDHSLDSLDLLVELRQAGDEAVAGELDRYERMRASQALTLDSMFHNLAERAGRQQTLPGLETLLRMALKAQSQSRATVEALATIDAYASSGAGKAREVSARLRAARAERVKREQAAEQPGGGGTQG